jgi:hypothetical protein
MAAASIGEISPTLTTGVAAGLNMWHVMSGPGTFHSSHVDACGFGTILRVREGLKGVLWARRRDSRRLIPIPSDCADWHWDLLKDCDVYLVVLGPGDTGCVQQWSSLCLILKAGAVSILGPGVPHCVMSLQKPGHRAVSTVMYGSHFLNRFSMEATLYSSIQHAFWHDVWTNATHDDRDFSIARMLAWQALRMRANAEWPFTGRNLYALLAMGMVPTSLLSLPFHMHAPKKEVPGDEMEVDEVEAELLRAADATAALWLTTYDPTADSNDIPSPAKAFLVAVRQEMGKISRLIHSKLPHEDVHAFDRYWSHVREVFLVEFERRCQYNRLPQS